jgi:hypothetical protein
MRAAPTEGIGSEMVEYMNFQNQPTLPTDAPPSANASAARPVTCTFTTTTHTTDHGVVEEQDPQDQPHLALDNTDDEEEGPDEHLLCEAEATIRRLV